MGWCGVGVGMRKRQRKEGGYVGNAAVSESLINDVSWSGNTTTNKFQQLKKIQFT